MTANLLRSGWTDLDLEELLFILLELIGKPGQYSGRETNPCNFYLPLAGDNCRVKLTFADRKQLVAIEPGPAFDPAQWEKVVQEIEATGPIKVGRDCSFSGYRVPGSWRGERSGVQILPPPADAPHAPYHMAEHPFILEFPVIAGGNFAVTNFRRIRAHRHLTFLLDVLLAARTTIQPRRQRHLWVVVHEPGTGVPLQDAKWAQEFYFTNFGEVIRDELSPPAPELLGVVDPNTYYARVGNDGGSLRVPADLDESICCYTKLAKGNRDKFNRAGFWLDMASRQWTVSFSASFASLVIAIEALAESGRDNRGRKFRNFIEEYARDDSLEVRRREMYDLRSEIIHGADLMEMDKDAHFGWAPPAGQEEELLRELWGLARIAIRSWLKNPSAP